MNDLGSTVFDVRMIVWPMLFGVTVVMVFWIAVGVRLIYLLLSGEPNEVAGSVEDPPVTDDQHLHLVE